MDNIHVRKITMEDADEISRIYAEITQTELKHDYIRVFQDHGAKDDASFAAVYEDKIVGYMISYILTCSFGIEKSAWIPLIGVDPQFMGRGIGKILAEKVFEHYKKEDIKHIYTSVRWYDADLLSFFKTLGFDRSEFINLRKGPL